MNFKTFHIFITGQVQGVGFRPFIYHLAQVFSLNGKVYNAEDGVHIEINTSFSVLKDFINDLYQSLPLLAKINSLDYEEIPFVDYQYFEISKSQSSKKNTLPITPDYAICTACSNDILNPENRRYNYAFTTCVHCGPRYSIIKSLPYDRPNTSMAEFLMCPECEAEYYNPTDRRYHSQTNSCPKCAIQLTLLDAKQNTISINQSECIDLVVESLKSGEIIAVKGIGGYLLIADALNEKAIQTLRNRKHRPSKPFGLCYPSIKRLKKDAVLLPEEIEILESKEAPLVLVHKKDVHQKIWKNIAPKLNKIAVMLPYTPLLALIMERFNSPIIATSGNISGSPIITEEQDLFNQLFQIADKILAHNREIIAPQDDSLIQYLPAYEQLSFLRRSRGFAPSLSFETLQYLCSKTSKTIIAFGSDMKNTWAIISPHILVISPYIGDMENYWVQKNFLKTLNHFIEIYHLKPDLLLTDINTSYFSTQLAEEFSNGTILIKNIQHHQAHFAGILAEHQLLETSEKILGVIWDGIGLGEDGHIWGGEFFIYQNYEFIRHKHLDYYPYAFGDKQAKEPRLSACAILEDFKDIENQFSENEKIIYAKLLAHSRLSSSSMGRLFDAVASVLNICHISQYEGEAAMKLQAYAEHSVLTVDFEHRYTSKILNGKELLKAIIKDKNNNIPTEDIAFKFHLTLSYWIFEIAKEADITHIALSGGVFQNQLLLNLIDKLNQSYHKKIYLNKEVSANDENISFGQIVMKIIQNNK